MAPPTHPADKSLKEYLGIDDEENTPTPEQRDSARQELRRHIDSQPPPESIEHARRRILDRMPRERIKSGSFDVRELERGLRESIERAAENRLALEIRRADEEHEKRLEAEKKLEKKDDRIWQVVLVCIAILIGAGAAGIGIGRATHEPPGAAEH